MVVKKADLKVLPLVELKVDLKVDLKVVMLAA